MPASALRLMSVFLLVIVVAVFGGDAIAGEASWGNLRYLLMRPISRMRLLGAKFFVAMLCAWIAVSLVVLTGLIAGAIAFGLHPLNVPILTQYSQSNLDLLGHLAIATVYVSWTLSTVVGVLVPRVDDHRRAHWRRVRRRGPLHHVARSSTRSTRSRAPSAT